MLQEYLRFLQHMESNNGSYPWQPCNCKNYKLAILAHVKTNFEQVKLFTQEITFITEVFQPASHSHCLSFYHGCLCCAKKSGGVGKYVDVWEYIYMSENTYIWVGVNRYQGLSHWKVISGVINDTWTQYGKIIVKDKQNRISVIHDQSELQAFS